MPPMRHVLIVSPHFPPTNAPDHQRVRMSLPYFREFGWEPTVLAVEADRVGAPRDLLLKAALPADVRVERVGAIPVGLGRAVGLGNVAYRAWFQLAATGARLLREARFDLVYFSTTQFVCTVLGPRWLRRFDVPFVVDVQDPWRTDYYERPGAPKPPGGWKYRFARWQAARLEERAWRDAAGFISVSPGYLEQLRERYRWFAEKPCAVIPFGAADSDFGFVRQHPEIPSSITVANGVVNLASVGAVGPIMRPALETLFGAVAQWRKENPSTAARLRLHFIGTSYAPKGRAILSVKPLADSCGIGDLVEEQPERIGYFSAIQTMLHAEGLILLGSDDPGYSPSKIGPCFLARRSTLAVMPANSVAATRIAQLKFAQTITVGDPRAAAQFASWLSALLDGSATHEQADRDEVGFARDESAQACTRRQCELFELALTTSGR